MQGDPKIDDLMRPVNAAIRRHVKDAAAVTDIYNRAYEAVMTSMDVKTGKTYCAYCGAEYPLDDSAATLVSEHIKTCAKHPMRAKEAETAALKRAEAAENVINAAHAVLVRQVAEPHTSRGDTNAMVEAITILETVTLKGGEK